MRVMKAMLRETSFFFLIAIISLAGCAWYRRRARRLLHGVAKTLYMVTAALLAVVVAVVALC